MALHPFTLPFENLPPTLPIFPLSNAMVMPGCQLPLNIFEPRYLNMVFDALGADRMIGMVQPAPAAKGSKNVPVYPTGSAGRIASFSETPDGRLLIILTGVCRFDIREEIPTTRGYRRVLVDWSRFAADYEFAADIPCDRPRLIGLIKEYFRRKGLDTNWENLEQMPATLLVNFLTSQLPFSTSERQVLVEEVKPEERLAKLVGFLEFEVATASLSNNKRH
jgi:Lon protease-like protein